MTTPFDMTVFLGEVTVRITDDRIDVLGPGSGPGSPELPAERATFRELARTDALGRYRPLTGARNLRRSWRARFPDLQSFTECLSEVYPLAFEHTAAWEAGELRVVGLDAVLARHSGRYGGAKELDERGRDVARTVLCARCVRVPLWAPAAAPAGELPEGGIPCPEPCSVLVGLCREAAEWQNDPPRPANVDLTVPFAEFEAAGNEIREAYLRARYPDGDG